MVVAGNKSKSKQSGSGRRPRSKAGNAAAVAGVAAGTARGPGKRGLGPKPGAKKQQTVKAKQGQVNGVASSPQVVATSSPRRAPGSEMADKGVQADPVDMPSPTSPTPATAPESASAKKRGRRDAQKRRMEERRAAAEAYDSSGDEEDAGAGQVASVTAPEPAPIKSKSKTRRGKKKGKVFLEDKAGLLDLAGDVTASKAATVEDKLARERARDAKAAEREEKRGPGKKGKKAAERQKALDAAKDAIVAREKEKRARRKRKPAESAAGAGEPAPKKRVGFA